MLCLSSPRKNVKAAPLEISLQAPLDIETITAADIMLKSLYPKLFHVTCVAHLLHNCAMKIKSHFEDVDQLIAKPETVVIKHKARQANFFCYWLPTSASSYKLGKLVKCCLVLRKTFA